MPEGELVQDQEIRTYSHCMRCRRGFKKPKTTSLGPVCMKKQAEKEARCQ